MACVVVSVHVGVVVEQSSVPVSQALLAGVHAAPFTHGTHAPVSHTFDMPQDVPFGSDLPVSTQTGRPVEQSIAPTWQTLVVMHDWPSSQLMHVPLSQTMPVPHDVPLLLATPVSWHVGPVAEQASVPMWHT